jgi:hypothetical protein
MENIHNVSMAFLQRRFMDFASPPGLQVRQFVIISSLLANNSAFVQP